MLRFYVFEIITDALDFGNCTFSEILYVYFWFIYMPIEMNSLYFTLLLLYDKLSD